MATGSSDAIGGPLALDTCLQRAGLKGRSEQTEGRQRAATMGDGLQQVR
jgi:hypothetical protein